MWIYWLEAVQPCDEAFGLCFYWGELLNEAKRGEGAGPKWGRMLLCLEEGEAVIIIDSPCCSLPFQSSLAALHSSRQAFARGFMVLFNATEIYGPKMDHLGFKNTLGNEIMRFKSLKIHSSLSVQLSFVLTVIAFKWSKTVIYPQRNTEILQMH